MSGCFGKPEAAMRNAVREQAPIDDGYMPVVFAPMDPHAAALPESREAEAPKSLQQASDAEAPSMT